MHQSNATNTISTSEAPGHNLHLCTLTNREEMKQILGHEIATRLKTGIERNGRASLVASGGTSPVGLYDLLQNAQLDWSKVSVTLSDDLWVAPSMNGSNEKLIRTHLLQGRAATARLVALKTAHATAYDAEADVHRAVSEMPRPFDVTLLGMGADGHTASLYPHAEGLSGALDQGHPALVCAIHPKDAAQIGERISLTLRAILGSQMIVIIVYGEQKRTALYQALAGTDANAMPIRAVLHQRITPVQVFWAP